MLSSWCYSRPSPMCNSFILDLPHWSGFHKELLSNNPCNITEPNWEDRNMIRWSIWDRRLWWVLKKISTNNENYMKMYLFPAIQDVNEFGSWLEHIWRNVAFTNESSAVNGCQICSNKETNSSTSDGWVNCQQICIFGRTIPLSCLGIV